MRRFLDDWLISSWIVAPLSYAVLFTLLEWRYPRAVPVFDDLLLALGGLVGLIGTAILLRAREDKRWPVLVAGLAWMFGAAFLRGTGLALDELLVPPVFAAVSKFILHVGSFIIFAYGSLVLFGVTPYGRKHRILKAAVRPVPRGGEDAGEGEDE